MSAVIGNATGLAPVAAPVVVGGKLADTAATTFQAALASQVKIASPNPLPAPIKPGAVAYFATPIAAPTLAALSEIPAAPSVPASSTGAVLPTLAVIKPTIAAPTTVSIPASTPVAIAIAETPAAAAPSIELPVRAAVVVLLAAPPSPPTNLPATVPARQGTDGKLPSKGNILPDNPHLSAPLVSPPAIGKADDGRADDVADDGSIDPVTVTDPSPQPLLALVAVAAPPVLSIVPERTAPAATSGGSSGPTMATVTAAVIPQIIRIASPAAFMSGPIVQAPAVSSILTAPLSVATPIVADGGLVVSLSTFAASPAPAPLNSVASLPVISSASPELPASLALIFRAMPVADPAVTSAAVALQPVVAALPVPAFANPAPASLSAPSQAVAGPLPRQFGVVPDALVTVSLATPVSDPGTIGAAMALQPVVVALPGPAVPDRDPAGLFAPSLSTASRLSRQSGVSRGANLDVPADNSADALLPAVAGLPVAVNPAGTTSAIAAPGAAQPQDFAALVDRLLEARASAQSSTPPQQISTSVTHTDFGKVSLTFQQDTARLSVSMTSADPGFARAAQSAIVTSGQAGVGQVAAIGQSSSGAAAGDQGSTGSFSQGLAQPDAPAPGNAGATGQSAGFSTGSGGSQQSQTPAQPQQRLGFIAAANRSPAGSAASAGAGTSNGIFA